MNAIDALLDHVLETDYDRLPTEAVDAAKAFILDTIGVGISGSNHPRLGEVKRAVSGWGAGRDARVWATGEWLPACSAVLVNAYQVHNQEYDSLHDRCVVHAPATILPALLAYAERHGGVRGRDLIVALAVGIDVAAFIGMAQGAPMRFFRPAMCGALGAIAALTKLARFDRERMHNAFGIMYSQLSGTMQAHTEGSPTLALQIGFNARAVVTAFDLAAQGFTGPKDILEGRFGYFALFDGEADWSAGSADLGRVFQVTRMSHKPFPTGRAAHGGIDGVLTLQARHGFTADDVARVRISAPPLIVHLVGRPAKPGMEVGYAKLCIGYVVATALLTGSVGVADFTAERLADPRRLALAQRVELAANDIIDANALAPQSVEVALKDGAVYSVDLPAVLGHPDRPLGRAEQLKKFEACCRSASTTFDPAVVAQLVTAIDRLDTIDDVRSILDLIVSDHASEPRLPKSQP
jgi:2-methylcitrate dehydratase PrpD